MILTARRSEIECELSWWSSMTTARRAWSAFALQETGPGAGNSGDMKWTHKDEQIPEMVAAVAQGFRVPPRWFLAEEQSCSTPW